MTPARLLALVEVDDYVHEQAERDDKPARRRSVSRDPAADLAALAAM